MNRSGTPSDLERDITQQEQVEDRLRRLERILELGGELVSATTLSPLLGKIVATATELTDSEAANILLRDISTDELRFWTPPGEEIRVPIEGSVAGTVLTSGEPLIVPDAQADPRYYREVDRQFGFETRSMLAVPLQIKALCVGVLEVLNKRGGQEFSQEDVETLVALAAYATIAIQNARLYGQAQELRDQLQAAGLTPVA
jgi:GAF domain-containing protein